MIPDIEEFIGRYDQYCDEAPAQKPLVVGLGIATGIAANKYKNSHLSDIVAFDQSETQDEDGFYLGGINARRLSSFVKPEDLVWGYSIARTEDVHTPHSLLPEAVVYSRGQNIPVYSARPLRNATRALFGTRQEPRYIIAPGSRIDLATDDIKVQGEAIIFAAIAWAVHKGRDAASLFMEDVEVLPFKKPDEKMIETFMRKRIHEIAESTLDLEPNHINAKYGEIFVDIKTKYVPEGFVGCALVAAPYFTLARKAVIFDNGRSIGNMTLQQWEQAQGFKQLSG